MLKNIKYKHLYIGLTLYLFILLYATTLFAGDATLSWDPPTTNADGTPLTDLAGYIAYYGTATEDYPQSIDVGNVTTYQVSNLVEGLTYYFAVTAYDTSGNESEYSDEMSKTIGTSNNPPTADPGGPYSGTEGQAITLDGSGSSDSDGSIVLYEWDIDNDGTYDYSSSSLTRSHTYAQQGTYTIKLRVTDNLGETDEATTIANISDTSPIANFAGSPISGTAPLTVDFTNNSTGYDQPLSYEWDFDSNDTTDSTAQNPLHTYNDTGTYTVKLTVTDSVGSTNSLTRTNYITVTVTVPPAVYDLTINISGKGTVMSNSSSINCGGNCSGSYANGTVVTLTTTPDSGWKFSGWSSACSGTGSCQVTMDADKSVTATFAGIPISSDDFNDGNDDGWTQKSGTWAVEGGEYSEVSALSSAPVFSLINIETQDMTIEVDGSDQGTGVWQNFFIVFAYDEFSRKAYWAGARVGADKWRIEEVDIDTGSLTYLAYTVETINTNTWYNLKVVVSGDTVTLYADDIEKVSYTFPGGIPLGLVGLGGHNNHAHFDDFSVTY